MDKYINGRRLDGDEVPGPGAGQPRHPGERDRTGLHRRIEVPAEWRDPRHENALRPPERVVHLQEGADLQDAYILGDGNGALSVVRHQLLLAGIRLAFLLDQNFATP